MRLPFVPLLRRSIGLQLITGALIIVAAVSFLSSAGSIIDEREVLHEQLESSTRALSRTAMAACVEPLLVEDYPVLETNMRLIVEEAASVVFAFVRREDGRVVAAFPPGADTEATVGSVRVFPTPIRIDVDDDSIGELVLGVSTAQPERVINRRVHSAVRDAVAAFLAIGVLLGLLVRRALGRPLLQLTQDASGLGSGDLTTPIRLDSDNELGRLANTLEQSRQNLASSEERLTKARDAAESASRAKSDFLANMSHEIRTPMTAILGYTDLLLDDESDDGAKLDAVQTIQRNGNHLLALINDILDLSRIESGSTRVELSDCSVVQILNDVHSLLSVRAEQANVSFVLELSQPLPERITTDSTRVRQVLINVAGNAIKFARDGEVRVTAEVVGDGEHSVLQVDVADTGIGMTPEQADRVFLAFRQAEESTTRTFGGTGLGLTISRRLAQSLGGDLVIVHTARGEGSRFRITVAIDTTDCTWLEHPATAVAVPADPEQTADGALETELSGHILLAEDGVDNQRLITHFLSRAGLEVTVVENGKLALETALESVKDGRPFDIIVTDINMPVMDGYRATQLLRERGWRRPIIALTANAMSDDEDRSLRAGCDAHLTKPIDRALLLRTVGRFLTSNELQS